VKNNDFRFIVVALCCFTAFGTPFGATFAAEEVPANDDKQSDSALEDIIVTAQRRAERLQDVPISVTALTPDGLAAAGVTSTADLGMVTPGLRMDATGNNVQPTIRGITTTLAQNSSESAVAIYEDGVYQQSLSNAAFELADVQQIEVLKGPQGTLFGRNATGGAILIQTLQPSLTDVVGQTSVSYGNFNDLIASGYISVPIDNDKVAASLTGYVHHDSGWKTNLLDNGQGSGYTEDLVRGKIRFEPWDGADFVLTGIWDKIDDEESLAFTNYLGNNIDRVLDPASAPFIASRPYQFSSNTAQVATKLQQQVSLHGDIVIGPGSLSTTTAYVHTDQLDTFDPTNGPVPTGNIESLSHIHNFEQEFVYTTDQLGRFRGTAGLFYYSLRAPQVSNVNNYSSGLYYTDDTDAYAAFGELTYDITDRFSVIGGVRLNTETAHSFTGSSMNTPVPPSLTLLGRHTWTAATPRASLIYKATDRTNVYFTYSQGFKSGAFNSSANQPTPVNPEKVNAYEFGVKSNEFQRLSLNAAAFYYDYNNLQVSSYQQINGVIEQILANAANAKIFGSEINAVWKTNDNFNLTFGGTYLHARYSSFPNAIIDVPTGLGGNMVETRNDSGTTMIRSPTLSANLTATYIKNTDLGTFDVSGTYFYSTKVYFELGDRVVQPGYGLLNANFGWKPSSDSKFRVGLWGKNLTNKAYITETVITQDYDAVDYGRPRTAGVEVQYKY